MSDSTTVLIIYGCWLGGALLLAFPYLIKWEEGQRFMEKALKEGGLIIALLLGMMLISGLGN
jgi:hypothetical protein